MKKQVRIISKSGGNLMVILDEDKAEQLKKDLNPELFFSPPISKKGEEVLIKLDAIDTLVISPISCIKTATGADAAGLLRGPRSGA